MLSQKSRNEEANDSLLSVLKGPERAISSSESFLALFKVSLKKNPFKIALVYGNKSKSYQDLDEESNNIANTLILLKGSEDKFVALFLDNGFDLVVSMLGAIKANVPFVPVDPDWPDDRLNIIVSQLNNPIIISDSQKPIGSNALTPVIDVSSNTSCKSAPTIFNSNEKSNSKLMYGFFTSGTTGTPKCALNYHSGLLNRFKVMTDWFGHPSSHTVLQNSKHIFDSSVWQIMWPLTGGGTVVLPKSAAIFNLDEVIETIDRTKVTMSDFVPSVFNILVQSMEHDHTVVTKLSSLKYLLLGGEEVNPTWCTRFNKLLPRVQLINTYGPTEASIGSVFHRIPRSNDLTIPIGKPIANTIAVVMDSNNKPVLKGDIGEIYIGGACLGAGYLNDQEKTTKAFVQVDHPEIPVTQMYKTGDLAKVNKSGELIYLGRRDFQVKINGVRIEIAELEGALLKHPSISEAKIVAEPAGGQKSLTAYITGRPTSNDELRKWLLKTLPSAYLPAKFLFIDKMPRTHNGKIDRKALNTTLSVDPQNYSDSSIESLTEKKVKELVSQLLNAQPYNNKFDFFDEGGDSLSAHRFSMAASRIFNVDYSVDHLYEDLTISAIVSRIDKLIEGVNPDSGKYNAEDHALSDCSLLDNLSISKIRDNSSPENILITGATGFIGAHTLHELIKTSSARIFCLVRSESPVAALERIIQTLKHYQLYDQTCEYKLSNIIPLPGSMDESKFGLNASYYAELSNTVDTVLNCGAQVDFLHNYKKTRPTNVLSVKDQIEFCVIGKPKIFQHVSSLAAFSNRGQSEKILSQDPVSIKSIPNDGYGMSKWVAEKLVDFSTLLGQPTNIFRLGEVGASTTTGIANKQSMLQTLLTGCLQLGLYPSNTTEFDYTPVDAVSKKLASIVLNPDVRNLRHHLLATTTVTVAQLLENTNRGNKTLKSIPYSEFYTTVKNQAYKTNSSNEIQILASLLDEPQGKADQTIFSNALDFFEANAELSSAIDNSSSIYTNSA